MASFTLQVEGMTCNHCVKAVEQAVKEAGAAAKVDLNSGIVEVEMPDASRLDRVKEAIVETGYTVK